MTFKTLLVHVEPDWGSGRALASATVLARRFGAHLIGLGCEAFEPVDYAFADGAVVQMLRDQIDADATTSQQRFRAATQALGDACSYVSVMQAPAEAMASYARGADLVVARRTPGDSSPGNLCKTADLVVGVGAPVLLVPEADSPLKAERVVVAWRDGPQARRALTDALPFLTAAQDVRLVEVCGPNEQDERKGLLQMVCDRLQRLGAKATGQVIAHPAAAVCAEVERVADGMGADLIVAGAYSHRRLQEWVLGGVTEDLILASARYVFFSR